MQSHISTMLSVATAPFDKDLQPEQTRLKQHKLLVGRHVTDRPSQVLPCDPTNHAKGVWQK
jgi:hypothetical protein